MLSLVRLILRIELNARNRIDISNSLALSVVTYSFTIINWSLIEIIKIYTEIRKLILIESSFCKRNVYVQLRFLFTKITVILCVKILCYLKLRDVLESEVIKVFYTFSRNELPNQYAVSLI